MNKVDVYFVSNADTDNEDAGFGIDGEKNGDELIRFTQDKNAKKYNYIPSRNKKIKFESFVVIIPSLKRKSGLSYAHRV
jgi:hypothetical protein